MGRVHRRARDPSTTPPTQPPVTCPLDHAVAGGRPLAPCPPRTPVPPAPSPHSPAHEGFSAPTHTPARDHRGTRPCGATPVTDDDTLAGRARPRGQDATVAGT